MHKLHRDKNKKPLMKSKIMKYVSNKTISDLKNIMKELMDKISFMLNILTVLDFKLL